jgi:hypothetical protein
MSDNIIQLNEEIIKTELKDLVRSSVEETSMPYLTRKPMNSSMPRNMSVPAIVRVTDLVITKEILLLLPEK